MKKYIPKIYIIMMLIIGLTIVIPFAVNGFDYYTTDISNRFFHADHETLKPSGAIGHGLGIVGSIMIIIGVSSYMIRKRKRSLMKYGALKYWLYFHIFLCSVGPILILFHTSLKFGGIASISFWSMTIVVASGVLGGLIYVRIPRTIKGREVSSAELQSQNQQLTNSIKNNFTVPKAVLETINTISSNRIYDDVKLLKMIPIITKDYFTSRKTIKSIKQNLKSNSVNKHTTKNIISICKSKVVLTRRIGLLKTMQKLFKYWHVAHLPFAISMVVIMLIHVTVTVMMGYRWIF